MNRSTFNKIEKSLCVCVCVCEREREREREREEEREACSYMLKEKIPDNE